MLGNCEVSDLQSPRDYLSRAEPSCTCRSQGKALPPRFQNIGHQGSPSRGNVGCRLIGCSLKEWATARNLSVPRTAARFSTNQRSHKYSLEPLQCVSWGRKATLPTYLGAHMEKKEHTMDGSSERLPVKLLGETWMDYSVIHLSTVVTKNQWLQTATIKKLTLLINWVEQDLIRIIVFGRRSVK